MAECQSCGRPVRWGVTTAGARMPLDHAPSTLGNVWIREDGKLRVLNADEAARAAAAGEVLWMSHFASCPNAAAHGVSRAQESMELGV